MWKILALLLFHAFGAVTWLGAFGLGVGEATPADQDISYLGFWVAAGVAAALWVAAAGLAVMRWRIQQPIWWIPFAWWIPTLILAFVIQNQFQN